MKSLRPLPLLILFVLSSCGTSVSPPAGSSSLPCANELDATKFGFTASIPADFECTATFPNRISLALVGYRQASTQIKVSVQVNPPQEEQSTQGEQVGEGVTVQEEGEVVTGGGLTFNQFRSELLGQFLYGAVGRLPSGNNLFITVASPTDSPALAEIRKAILESVRLTP